MATVSYSEIQVANNVIVVRWSLANGDDGTPYLCGSYPEKSVQWLGTPGAGFAARVEGTNDVAAAPATGQYATLKDANDTDLTVATAPGIVEVVRENTRLIRPRVTAGDGTTAVTCNILMYRSRRQSA